MKGDLEKRQPMDRLVCGDVGYGKTEVALRAAFKTVSDGMQVGVLVPTTVLAQQHYATFTERLAPFPVRVAVLSRFRTRKEQAEVVEGLKLGTVDIVIGTHRLLQKDVRFKNLGLVVVDEEHRFGVAHKERLKQMRREVDMLTLSATPIPRTLYMGLSGIRDMSTMDTPPEERLPVKTYVSEYSDDVVREAILRELERGGQVFLLHNRVQTIRRVEANLRKLLPQARVAVGHGRMAESELEDVMLSFSEGDVDVLVCTTIIESGLDIPNANTLIIDRADRFGLAQLYQLRGRVGRGRPRAYAYMLVPRGRRITETATRRLKVILEATELGAGFRIAMRDLEIRGAGNLLGAEQSGYIHAVGFDLYSQLLNDAVADIRSSGAPGSVPVPENHQERAQARVDLELAAHIPESYVSHLPTRLGVYQRLSRVRVRNELDDTRDELRDRFGPLPEEVENLLYLVDLKLLAARRRWSPSPRPELPLRWSWRNRWAAPDWLWRGPRTALPGGQPAGPRQVSPSFAGGVEAGHGEGAGAADGLPGAASGVDGIGHVRASRGEARESPAAGGQQALQLGQAGYPRAVVDPPVPAVPVQEDGVNAHGPGTLYVGLILIAHVHGLGGSYAGPVQGRFEDGRMGFLGARLHRGDAEVHVRVQAQPGAQSGHVPAQVGDDGEDHALGLELFQRR